MIKLNIVRGYFKYSFITENCFDGRGTIIRRQVVKFVGEVTLFNNEEN